MKARNESLDVLRCFAMLMIVALHVVGQGGILAKTQSCGFLWYLPSAILQYAFLCAVDVFMLLSGFFGWRSKFRYSRIAMLYLQTLFWSFVLAFFTHWFYPRLAWKIPPLAYIPLFTMYYWFFTSYFIVFFAMPALNSLANAWTRQQFRTCILIFFFLFCILTGNNLIGLQLFRGHQAFLLNNGYSPLWLGYVYFLGAFLGKHGVLALVPENMRHWFLLHIPHAFKLQKKAWCWMGGVFHVSDSWLWVYGNPFSYGCIG